MIENPGWFANSIPGLKFEVDLGIRALQTLVVLRVEDSADLGCARYLIKKCDNS